MSESSSEKYWRGFQQIAKTSTNILDPLTLFAQEGVDFINSKITEISPGGFDASNPNLEIPDLQVDEILPNNDPSVVIEESDSFLSGERKLMNIKDSYLQICPGKMISGTLVMTNYRLYFVPSSQIGDDIQNYLFLSWSNIPLACIDRIEKEKKLKDSKTFGVTINISCKDLRYHKIAIHSRGSDESDVDKAIGAIIAYAFPKDVNLLFAFSHRLPSSCQKLIIPEKYDVFKEFTRLGVLDGTKDILNSSWRLCYANFDYRLCNTYPKILIMPARMSDEEFFLVASFRSGQRLPTMSWSDKGTGATLWRSSQPKAGVSGTCWQDEKLLELLAQSVNRKLPGNKMVTENYLFIVDCRPRASALANRATGAGYETQTNYPNSRLEFFNIPNIHSVRESFKSISNLLLQTNNGGDPYFSKQIEDTQWLTNSRLILKASWETASMISKGIPVLVHCSHGWDRTAQVSALAQIFLDSFYRTINGFRVLIEKEWCSFGHQFHLRSGHGLDKGSRQDDQISQIFLQFLDCVWQLLNQFPHFFEFNKRYVLCIADHLYSCRFGTFLFNSDLERDEYPHKPFVDIWVYLANNLRFFKNPLYLDPEISVNVSNLFLPPISQILRNVCLWSDYFYRWSALPTINFPHSNLLREIVDDHGMSAKSIELEFSSIYEREATSFPPDFQLMGSITNDDVWEAAYRQQRREKEELKQLLKLKMSEISELTQTIEQLKFQSNTHEKI